MEEAPALEPKDGGEKDRGSSQSSSSRWPCRRHRGRRCRKARTDSRSILNSSRHQMTQAKTSRLIMSPVAGGRVAPKRSVADRRPVAASTGGIQAVGVERSREPAGLPPPLFAGAVVGQQGDRAGQQQQHQGAGAGGEEVQRQRNPALRQESERIKDKKGERLSAVRAATASPRPAPRSAGCGGKPSGSACRDRRRTLPQRPARARPQPQTSPAQRGVVPQS